MAPLSRLPWGKRALLTTVFLVSIGLAATFITMFFALVMKVAQEWSVDAIGTALVASSIAFAALAYGVSRL